MRRNTYTELEGKDIDWSVLKSLWPYLLEFKGRVALALGLMVCAKLASVGLPYVLKFIVDDLDKVDATAAAVAAPIGLVLFYGLIRFLTTLFNELRDTVFGRVTERAMRRIGLSVFQHLHQLDIDFHLSRKTGGLSRDIERGTSGINFLMRFMVFNIVPTLLEVFLIAGILFYSFGWLYGVIVLVSVAAYVYFSMKATDWRSAFVREANQADSSSSTRAIDSLLNFETVKYFTNEKYEADRYDENLADWEKAKRKNRLSLFALNGGQSLIIALAMTSMLVLAAVNTVEGDMTLGDFVLVNAFMMQLFIPLGFLGFVYREIKSSMVNIEAMVGLLKVRPKVVDKPDAKPLKNPQGDVVFDGVDFNYDSDRQILKQISFALPAGKKVAVVGESGSGKSTVVKLLLRLYDTVNGRITIDGENIAEVTQQSLRASIGIVPQDTVLFNDSIFENIRYGRPGASDSEVENAIRMAHLSDFIAALPKGGETLVGERGLKLSGGEKQRVAIARTILKGAQILVFDEATSSLDSHSEKSILQALGEIEGDHTRLVIAHRLSTVVDADSILVLHQGEVVEQGDHQALLQQRGRYAHLWELQQQEA
ncbi:MAG: ABC transporter ATP-binding protein/permease [Cellvibrionaceae bacterium]